MSAGRRDDLTAIDIGSEIVPVVVFEARLQSQGIETRRLDPDLAAPPSLGQSEYRLLVHKEDVPLVVEELSLLRVEQGDRS